MNLNDFMNNPYMINTLSSITVYLVSKLATKFGKKPVRKKLYDEVDMVISDINFDSDEIGILFDFMKSEQVHLQFYNYINYRTYKTDNKSTLEIKKVSIEDFINIMIDAINQYSKEYNNYEFSSGKLKQYIQEVINKIDEKIIDKLSEENLFFVHSLTNIELLLEDIRAINGMTLSRENNTCYKSEFTKYIEVTRGDGSRVLNSPLA